MRQAAGKFLKSSVQPLPGLLSAASLVPFVVAVVLVARDHVYAASMLAMASLAFLFLVAGIKLQSAGSDAERNKSVREMLSMHVQMGQVTQSQIEWAEDDFLRDPPGFDLDERGPHSTARKWETSVERYLKRLPDRSIEVRFGNVAGLTPSTPPRAMKTEMFIDAWQTIDLRLQRLDELIREVR